MDAKLKIMGNVPTIKILNKNCILLTFNFNQTINV